jgi:tRNA threonylcarbamoyladenosine modification (KEOPS) complex  Pcc1 subunit
VKAKAFIRLPLKSEEHLEALMSALTPEVQRQIGVRSKVALSTEAQTLVLTVDAEDTVALRAALNSYLRWITSTLKVLQAVTQKS